MSVTSLNRCAGFEAQCAAVEAVLDPRMNNKEDVRGVLRYANRVIAVERPCGCCWWIGGRGAGRFAGIGALRSYVW